MRLRRDGGMKGGAGGATRCYPAQCTETGTARRHKPHSAERRTRGAQRNNQPTQHATQYFALKSNSFIGEAPSPLKRIHPYAATPRRRDERRGRRYHQVPPSPPYRYRYRAPARAPLYRWPNQRTSRTAVILLPVCTPSE